MSKLFKYTGTCRRDGHYKVVYTNNKNYDRVLTKDGYEDVKMRPMILAEDHFPGTKWDCVDLLLNSDLGPEREAVIEEAKKLEFLQY